MNVVTHAPHPLGLPFTFFRFSPDSCCWLALAHEIHIKARKAYSAVSKKDHVVECSKRTKWRISCCLLIVLGHSGVYLHFKTTVTGSAGETCVYGASGSGAFRTTQLFNKRYLYVDYQTIGINQIHCCQIIGLALKCVDVASRKKFRGWVPCSRDRQRHRGRGWRDSKTVRFSSPIRVNPVSNGT